MTWLKNSWYQAGWSNEIGSEGSLVRTILNEPILLFRQKDLHLTALLDRCPHRFAPLSAGRIEDGKVTCGYHGLAFGVSGICVGNPHGPITSAMRVKAYPVEERHTGIWIWMGDPDRADTTLIPDLSFIDDTPENGRISGYMPTTANYLLLADNILDLSHADYLHPTTLGGIMTGSKASTREVGDTVVAEWTSSGCVPPPAFRLAVPNGLADMWTQVVWSPPGVLVLSTAAMPAGAPRGADNESHTLHNMVPESATSTHYFFCQTRRYLIEDEAFTAKLRVMLRQAFENEDKPMLEKQQQRMDTDDLWSLNPILLPIDAGAVRARRKLSNLIEAERALTTSPTA